MTGLRPTNGNGVAAPLIPGHWAALKGRWSFESGLSIYEGPFEGQPQPYGLTLSDLRLQDGRTKVTISFAVFLMIRPTTLPPAL